MMVLKYLYNFQQFGSSCGWEFSSYPLCITKFTFTYTLIETVESKL